MAGIEVELPYLSRRFKVRLEDDALLYDVYTEMWKGGKRVSSGTMGAYLDMSVTHFVRACKDMTERELLELGADLALNGIRGR